MKDNDRDSLRSPSPPVTGGGGGGDAAGLFGKRKYKAWALAAILLLAFWSMLTGTVTLNFSTRRHGLLSSDDLVETPLREDLDVLEIEEREKLAKRMWDAYMHSERGPLPSFWQKAFEAAYEDLSGTDERARQAAISEIARMSLRILDLDPPSVSSNLKVNKVYVWGDMRASERGPLLSFWQKAFEAAYEDLSGTDERARQVAISEIARMSLRILDLDPLLLVTSRRERSRRTKEAIEIRRENPRPCN